jgi:hypothetical protein
MARGRQFVDQAPYLQIAHVARHGQILKRRGAQGLAQCDGVGRQWRKIPVEKAGKTPPHQHAQEANHCHTHADFSTPTLRCANRQVPVYGEKRDARGQSASEARAPTIRRLRAPFVVYAYAARRVRQPASSAGSSSLVRCNEPRPRITSAAFTSAWQVKPHTTQS